MRYRACSERLSLASQRWLWARLLPHLGKLLLGDGASSPPHDGASSPWPAAAPLTGPRVSTSRDPPPAPDAEARVVRHLSRDGSYVPTSGCGAGIAHRQGPGGPASAPRRSCKAAPGCSHPRVLLGSLTSCGRPQLPPQLPSGGPPLLLAVCRVPYAELDTKDSVLGIQQSILCQ